LPERANPSVLRASFTDKELMSVYWKKSSPSELERIEELRARVAGADLRNQQLQSQLQTANATLDSVLNSKGWRFLNWCRQVRDRLRHMAGRS
jgi:hypothetical protein